MGYSKHPLTYLMLLGALLMGLGGLFDWYTYPEGMDAVGRTSAHNVVLVVGVLGLVVTHFAAKGGSKGLMVLNLLFALVGLVVFSQNHVSQAPLLEEVGVGMSGLFMVAMLGALLYLVGVVAGLVKFKK